METIHSVFNGVYTELKSTGKKALESIKSNVSDNGYGKHIVISPDSKDYLLKFRTFEIDFIVKIELKTDCESTGVGNIGIYYIDYTKKEPVEICFPLATIGGSPTHLFEFKKTDGMHYKIVGGGCENFLDEFSAGSFGDYFMRLFPSAIQKAKLSIPL